MRQYDGRTGPPLLSSMPIPLAAKSKSIPFSHRSASIKRGAHIHIFLNHQWISSLRSPPLLPSSLSPSRRLSPQPPSTPTVTEAVLDAPSRERFFCRNVFYLLRKTLHIPAPYPIIHQLRSLGVPPSALDARRKNGQHICILGPICYSFGDLSCFCTTSDCVLPFHQMRG
ncbi:hypothetical protein H4582DRAFT_391152 [Lactarius indigo]|nr:hypothetical protein H4582DRAFT_391152 [Lactarius indigo]